MKRGKIVRDKIIEDKAVRGKTVKDEIVRSKTVKAMAVGNTTVKAAAVKNTTVKDTIVRDITVKDTTGRDTTVKAAAVRNTAVRNITVKDTAVKNTTVKDTIVRDMTIEDKVVVQKEKGNLYNKIRRYAWNIRKFAAICCCMCLLCEMSAAHPVIVHASLAKGETESGEETEEEVTIGEATDASTYIKSEDWPEGPSVDAEGAVLIEAETGTVLYAKNPDTKLYPASITKIMTALLTLEDSELTDTVVYEGEALTELPSNYVSLPVSSGEEMSVEDCLYALLMMSANNVANALAVHDSGTIAAFAEKMNERAEAAGAKNTHFNNPSGLHEENHYTTPYDMCMIMRECIQYDAFIEMAGSRVYTLSEISTLKTEEERTIYALHRMLFPTRSEYYEYCVCGKTGYTDQAGNTLITYAEKDGMKLICCVMGCGSGVAYTDTEALFEYGFSNFTVVDASDTEERFTLTDTGIFASENMSLEESFNIEVNGESYVVLPTGVSLNKLDTEIEYLTDAEDGCFAEVSYTYQGTAVGSARLKMSSASADDADTFDFDSHAETADDADNEIEGASDSEDIADNEGGSSGDGEQTADIWSKTKNIDVRIIIAAAVVIVLILIIGIINKVWKKNSGIRFNKKRKRKR